jgi:hypothetical protein
LEQTEIREWRAKLRKAKVNPEVVLNYVIRDIVMRQQKSQCRDVVGVMRACRRDLKALARKTYALAQKVGRLQSDDLDTVLALARRYDARARAIGAMVKQAAPRFKREAIVDLLDYVQQATGSALRHLPVIAEVLDSAREVCGVSSRDESLASLEKTLRRHVLPSFSKQDKTPLKTR